MRLQPLFSLLAESRHIFGCRPKARAAKSREKLFARVTIKTWQKPETELEKSLAPRSVKMDLSNMKEKPWQSCEQAPLKQLLRKVFQISKSAWQTGSTHTILKENLLTEKKNHRKKAALLKQNNKEEKEIFNAVVTQYQPLVSTMKEALMKKWNPIQNRSLLCQICLLFPSRKKNLGNGHAC